MAPTEAAAQAQAQAQAQAADGCLWGGVNYTFDGRRADPLAGAHGRSGRCCYCGADWHTLSTGIVCSLCKDQLLVCADCEAGCRSRAAATAAAAAAVATREEASPVASLPGAVTAAQATVAAAGTAAPAVDNSAFVPGDAAAQQKGVNFSARLAAERASAFLCTEHSLLSGGWRSFLARAEAAGLPRPALRSALRQLRRQLAASKGRGGQGRRRTLQAQIERLEVWLRGQAAAAEDEASGGGSGDDQGGDGPDGEFSAFFPLLNLWSYS